MPNAGRTWHHGLVARWWAEFNQGGDDIAYFLRVIERSGQPVLDAGCGTGRVLMPLVRAGIDIDGSDASGDMLDLSERNLHVERVEPVKDLVNAIEPCRAKLFEPGLKLRIGEIDEIAKNVCFPPLELCTQFNSGY